MVKLQKTTAQKTFATPNSGEEVRMVITVDYDPRDYSIEIISVEAIILKFYSINGTVTYGPMRTSAELLPCLDSFLPSLASDVRGMDWESEYRHYQEERRRA